VHTVEVSHVAKRFGDTQAVDDVSFVVDPGEIFGLLGPNGAGKTTTIRLMLDVFKPDRGTVLILDGPMTEAKKERIGYMPEERGLYQDITLDKCLVYLGTLKGLSTAESRQRTGQWLERFDLAAHKGKKVKDLSKGMQQKAQLIAALMHRPCDRILLIDHGRDLLYGNLDEIRRRYAGHAVLVRVTGDLPDVAGVIEVAPHNNATKLTLAEGTTPNAVLEALMAQGLTLEKFEIAVPTVEEIFIRVVEGEA